MNCFSGAWRYTYIKLYVFPVSQTPGVEVTESSDTKAFDTRSFIMSRPQLEESETRSQQHAKLKEDIQSALLRTVQSRYTDIYTTDLPIHT